jgi:hypothetical protein
VEKGGEMSNYFVADLEKFDMRLGVIKARQP